MYSVYLFQPNYQTGSGKFVTYWLPYSVATLWAYVEQFEHISNNFKVEEFIYKRDLIEQVLDQMKNPSVCLFSVYLWNEEYCLQLAKSIKQKYPYCKIVFGGPQIPKNWKDYLSQNTFIDSVVINEGEKSLLKLLEDVLDNNLQKSYEVESRTELEKLPSPYTDSNLIYNLIKKNPDVNWAATLETNRGCPFKCTFCDWGSLTQSKIKIFDIDKVLKEIEWMALNKIHYLVIADANFGVFYERDKRIIEHIVKNKKNTGYPKTLSATWYKNSAEKTIELVSILNNVNLSKGLTLSVQSLNEPTLNIIERKNMELSKLKHMYNECDKKNVNYYTEFILGMPLETLETWKTGICTAIDNGCHYFLDVYPLEILKNSAMVNQIDEYNLKVLEFKTINPQQDSKIFERHNYVVSTSTLTLTEYIDSWMWTWLIVNFHNYGWTQILSKFFLKHYNLNSKRFYELFLTECILKNRYLTKLYKDQRNKLENFYFDNKEIKLNDYVLIDRDSNLLHSRRKYIQEVINDWVCDHFEKNDLLEQVLKFNHEYITNKERHTDKEISFDYNLNEYINLDKNLENVKTKYIFSNKISWEDEDDFYQKIYFRAKWGFNLQEVRIIP